MQIINPDLFSFFSKLKENNNRDWFQSNKTEFKLLEGQVKLFMKQIEENLQIHDKIEKAKMFRIYRDVRFSKIKHLIKIILELLFTEKSRHSGEVTTFIWSPIIVSWGSVFGHPIRRICFAFVKN